MCGGTSSAERIATRRCQRNLCRQRILAEQNLPRGVGGWRRLVLCCDAQSRRVVWTIEQRSRLGQKRTTDVTSSIAVCRNVPVGAHGARLLPLIAVQALIRCRCVFSGKRCFAYVFAFRPDRGCRRCRLFARRCFRVLSVDPPTACTKKCFLRRFALIGAFLQRNLASLPPATCLSASTARP
jgi:hypothetical protein